MIASAEHPLAWLEQRASRRGSEPALKDDRGTLDYATLWDGLGRWARLMSGAGLEAGQSTAILTASRPRLARAIWLAMYSGFPLLTMSPSQTAPARLMRQCGVRQAIADADIPLPDGVRRLPAGRLDEVAPGPGAPPTPIGPDQPQLLVPTSGTKTPARAAMISAGNLAASASATARALDLDSTLRWLCCLPLIHVAGIMILVRAAAAGGAALIHRRFDVALARATIEAGEATHLSLVPAMLHRLVEAGTDPASLRTVLVGGAPVAGYLAGRAAAAGWRLTVAYGLTETTAHIALGSRLPGSLSMMIQPGTRVDIIDAGGRPTGDAGWIRVRGPTVMLGYANPALEPGDGLEARGSIRTNDLGRVDPEGRLRVIGRGDDVLISGGNNVHPGQVEDLLAGCPGIREVAVTGVPDPVWGARIVALYAGDAEEERVAAWAGENLPAALRPRLFRRVEALPRTPLGKIERRSLGQLLPPGPESG